jgi:hypothetical protein
MTTKEKLFVGLIGFGVVTFLSTMVFVLAMIAIGTL